VPFWRRDEPVHERLAREGGLVPERGTRDGRQRWFESLVGVHGVHRPREWDVVATTVAPGIAGDRVIFAVLADKTLLIEEGKGDFEPLAGVVEGQLGRPYRVIAVRQEDDRWAVAANEIEALDLPGLQGDEITVTRQGMNREVVIDGVDTDVSIPTLEKLVDESYDAFVLEADRLDGDLWEVRITPL
jgi:hypothetical protein